MPDLKESDVRIIVDRLLGSVGWDLTDKREVETEAFTTAAQRTGGIVQREEMKPGAAYAPIFEPAAEAGGWSADQVAAARNEELGWMKVPSSIRLTPEYFITRVEGRSMEPAIPDGSYALFRELHGGSRNGKKVLVWNRSESEGGRYTVKVYESSKKQSTDGTWEHEEIRLRS